MGAKYDRFPNLSYKRPPLALGPTVGAGSRPFDGSTELAEVKLRTGLKRGCLRDQNPTWVSYLQGVPPTPSPPRLAADQRECLEKRKGRETCRLTPVNGRLYDARQSLSSHNSPPSPDVNAFLIAMRQSIADSERSGTQKCRGLCLVV